MGDMEQYERYFTAGMKVGVGIPLPNAEVFRDWAVIHELDEDLVALQLSRDQLPVGVTLHVGQILEIRGGSEDSGYSVRAIIVSEGYAKELLLRLIGEVVSDELREFYRIDAFLPIKYYLSHEQNPEVLGKQWQIRRQDRLRDELVRRQKRWDSMYMGGDAELPHERHHEEHDDQEFYDAWDTIIPLAANISGGGVRLMTHQGFEGGEYVLLEILVPSPRRIVDAVARVAFANPDHAARTDHQYFNTGFKFIFIDERDRDSIVNYISSVQLKRIRQLREKYLFRSGVEAEEVDEGAAYPAVSWEQRAKKLLFWVVMVWITWELVDYLRHYTADHPKNEIEEVFENGIKKYIEKQRRY